MPEKAEAFKNLVIVLLSAEDSGSREAAVASVNCLSALAWARYLKNSEGVRAQSRYVYEMVSAMHNLDERSLSTMTSKFGNIATLYLGAGYISVSTTAHNQSL